MKTTRHGNRQKRMFIRMVMGLAVLIGIFAYLGSFKGSPSESTVDSPARFPEIPNLHSPPEPYVNDPKLISAIKDFTQGHNDGFFHLVHRTATQPATIADHRAPKWELDGAKLEKDPQRFRGQLVRMRGELMYLYDDTAESNDPRLKPSGRHRLWRGLISARGRIGVMIYVLDKDRAWKTAMRDVHGDTVEIVGTFYKYEMVLTEDLKKPFKPFPVLICRQMKRWKPATLTDRVGIRVDLVIAGFLACVLLLFLWLVVRARRDHLEVDSIIHKTRIKPISNEKVKENERDPDGPAKRAREIDEKRKAAFEKARDRTDKTKKPPGDEAGGASEDPANENDGGQIGEPTEDSAGEPKE